MAKKKTIDPEEMDYSPLPEDEEEDEEEVEVLPKTVQLQMKSVLDRMMVLSENQTNIVGILNNLKAAFFQNDGKLDTILARVDSIGTVAAQSAPIPVPATMAPPMVVPAAPTTAPATFEKKAPKARLPMDGSVMHGTSTGMNKKGQPYRWENVTITPTEFTDSAGKVSFEGSYNKDYPGPNVWLPYSMINSSNTITRLQTPQTLQVPDWWIRVNSKQG